MKNKKISYTLLALILITLSVVLDVVFLSPHNETKQEFSLPKDLNIILIAVDTLTSRSVSSYGSTTQTPNIDALAKEGVRFARTYSPAPWTKPAFASIFSGTYPKTHNVTRLESKIPDNIHLLAEMLKSTNRQTAAIVSHTILAPKAGYSRGFDFFKNVNASKPHKNIVSEDVTNTAINWLNKRNQPQNFFMFLHYFDPHYNYNHHPDFNETADYKGKLKPATDIRDLRANMVTFSKADTKFLRGLYAEEVRYTDSQIGRFINFLKEKELLNNTLIIFVADHGEEVMERGWIGHTRNLYNDLISVPFIIHMPNYIKPQEIFAPVSSVDIVPTILDIVKAKTKATLDGQSLLPVLLNKKTLADDQIVYSDVNFESGRHIKDAFKTAVIKGNYKLIHNRENDSFELYDVVSDPNETKRIGKENPIIVKELSDLLFKYENSKITEPAKALDITPEEVKQLQSLGYM